ncbi:hypothetical protein GCM10012275_21000 [Longimycelium tulufanense]|uniref:Uncharacterized protein n=1 Tax=Longimycelium tulufanense TaxID=907463 RepID=A0A8J3CAC0_9PSEU|nr:hypothetical protein [Longimycelium tulufanense]GGM49895.1 hypothetical protein GCM10012275_21000 [Longimycelium tulufanense]
MTPPLSAHGPVALQERRPTPMGRTWTNEATPTPDGASPAMDGPWADYLAAASRADTVLSAAARGVADVLPDSEGDRLRAVLPRLADATDDPDSGPGHRTAPGSAESGRLLAWCLRQLPTAVTRDWWDAVVEAVETARSLLTGTPVHTCLVSDAYQYLQGLRHQAVVGAPAWLATEAVIRALDAGTCPDGCQAQPHANASAYLCARAVPDPLALLSGLLDFHLLITGRKPEAAPGHAEPRIPAARGTPVPSP